MKSRKGRTLGFATTAISSTEECRDGKHLSRTGVKKLSSNIKHSLCVTLKLPMKRGNRVRYNNGEYQHQRIYGYHW